MEPEEFAEEFAEDNLPSVGEVVAERFPWFPNYKNKDRHHNWLGDILADFRRQLLLEEGDVLEFLRGFFELRGRSAELAEFEPKSYDGHLRDIFVRAWAGPSNVTNPGGSANTILYDAYDTRPLTVSNLIERLTILWAHYPTKRDVWSYVVATIVANHCVERVTDFLTDRAIMQDPCLRQAFPRCLGGISDAAPAEYDYMMQGGIHLRNHIEVSKARLGQIVKILGGYSSPDFRNAALGIARSVANFYFYKGYARLLSEGRIAPRQLLTPKFMSKQVKKSGLEIVIEEYTSEEYLQMHDRLPEVAKYDQPLWRIQEIVLFHLFASIDIRDYISIYYHVAEKRDELIDMPVKLCNDPWRLLEELELTEIWGEDPQEAVRRIFWGQE